MAAHCWPLPPARRDAGGLRPEPTVSLIPPDPSCRGPVGATGGPGVQGEPTGQPPKEDAPQASHRPHSVPWLGSAMSRQPPASPAVPWFPTLCLNELLAENELGAAGRQGRREEKTSPQDAVQTASSFLGSLLPDLCAPRGHPGNGRWSWVLHPLLLHPATVLSAG